MNFSVGVNVLFALTQQLAGTLDEDFDIEIVEMHHKHKVDAPSGTALGLAQERPMDGVDSTSSSIGDGTGLQGSEEGAILV